MADKRPATPKEMLVVGLIAACIGLFFVLIGLGLVPPPGGKKALHAPLWVVLCAGLAFLLAGAALLLHLASGAKASDEELPPDAPRWMRVVRYLIMLAIFASFGAIGSWVAFGPGDRAFSLSMPFFSGPASEMIGRAAFGIGAIVVWLCTIAIAVSGARKLLGREKV
ncbi:MAG TPA: hypothetical protein VH765_10100 [Xanthobacteraceae bacterium]|jgi:hypothetical protein